MVRFKIKLGLGITYLHRNTLCLNRHVRPCHHTMLIAVKKPTLIRVGFFDSESLSANSKLLVHCFFQQQTCSKLRLL
jgi:hypothetical protein